MSRRTLFTTGMLLLPVLFFALLEVGLRLAGYGQEYPLFIPVPGTNDWMTTNRDVARRYFAGDALAPTPIGDSFRTRRDSTTFRIVVQGGSSAAGYPYQYGGSFSRMLAQRLQQSFPDRRIEVVNTAMSAVNSYTLLDFAREIVAIEPDAILIYAGHNEYYGALGVGSTESIGRLRGLVNLYLRLQNWRTLQATRGLLSWVAGLFAPSRSGQPPARTLMERMVAEQRIPLGSPLYRMGLAQFEGNMTDLLDTYRKAGIPVFMSTLASNERGHPPFESAPGPGTEPLQWANELGRATDLAERGDTPAALEAFESLERTDSIDADVHFAHARLLDGLGRHDEALAQYLAAKDRDQLRFRAPEDVNRILRSLADRFGAHVVDGQEALRRMSPGRIIDFTLMLEHLHPNIDGYFLLSDAFYEALLDEDLPGPNPERVPAAQARSELLATAVDSLSAGFRVRQLLGSWPFRAPGTFDTSLDTLTGRSTIEQLALGLYRGQVSWFEATDRLRQYYMQTGDYHKALQSALAMVQQYPFLPEAYAFAGEALFRQRRAHEALAYYEAACDIRDSPVIRSIMGDLWTALSDPVRAAAEYQRATRLAPDDVDIALKLGRAHATAGNLEAARRALEEILRRVPDDPRAGSALIAIESYR